MPDRRWTPWCDIGRGSCIPPFGAKEGDVIEASEGDDSACRREGVGGAPSLANDLLKVGVWMVRLAGRRLPVLGGIAIGDAGASKWCFELVSSNDAVAMGGRDWEGGGIRRDRFLRLRARRLEASGLGF